MRLNDQFMKIPFNYVLGYCWIWLLFIPLGCASQDSLSFSGSYVDHVQVADQLYIFSKGDTSLLIDQIDLKRFALVQRGEIGRQLIQNNWYDIDRHPLDYRFRGGKLLYNADYYLLSFGQELSLEQQIPKHYLQRNGTLKDYSVASMVYGALPDGRPYYWHHPATDSLDEVPIEMENLNTFDAVIELLVLESGGEAVAYLARTDQAKGTFAIWDGKDTLLQVTGKWDYWMDFDLQGNRFFLLGPGGCQIYDLTSGKLIFDHPNLTKVPRSGELIIKDEFWVWVEQDPAQTAVAVFKGLDPKPVYTQNSPSRDRKVFSEGMYCWASRQEEPSATLVSWQKGDFRTYVVEIDGANIRGIYQDKLFYQEDSESGFRLLKKDL